MKLFEQRFTTGTNLQSSGLSNANKMEKAHV